MCHHVNPATIVVGSYNSQKRIKNVALLVENMRGKCPQLAMNVYTEACTGSSHGYPCEEP